MLHMYVLTVRLRALPSEYAPAWHQHLTDHFFFAAEAKMTVLHGMVSRSIRSRYLKDLFGQWRGCLLSYDEGLVKGDAMLAAAVWRSIFKGTEEVDAVELAMVVGYLRNEIASLGCITDEDLAMANVRFGNLIEQKPIVLMKSHLMNKTV